MDESNNFKETAKEIYKSSLQGLLECNIGSLEAKLYLDLVKAATIYFERINCTDNLNANQSRKSEKNKQA